MATTPTSGERALGKALKERAFERAYYFFGDDDFRKEEALRQVVDAAVDPATRDFNLETRRGGEIDAGTLGSLLGTPPMMADRRVLVLRDAGSLRKDARAVLVRYLGDPAPDAIVLLVSPMGEKPEKELVTRATEVEFAPLTGDRVLRWIERHAAQQLDARIDAAAARLLVDAVGEELQQLSAELDKLASYTQGAPIDEAAVSAVVGVRRGETLGDFLDAVGERDAMRALGLIEHVLQQPKTTAVSVVMALTVQTLALGWGVAMRERGANPGQLSREYFDFLKSAGAFVGRAWGEAIQHWVQELDRWTIPAVDRALALLLEADVALKETRLSSDEQLLATLVLAICAEEPGRVRRAA